MHIIMRLKIIIRFYSISGFFGYIICGKILTGCLKTYLLLVV